MSKKNKVPSYLKAKSNEIVTKQFLDWVNNNKERLKKNIPPAEKKFNDIIESIKYRIQGIRNKKIINCNRQKAFLVAEGVVFYGDFMFNELKLLVEIDGPEHYTEEGREKDYWRTKLLTEWKIKVCRIHNDTVLNSDFRKVETWLFQNIMAFGNWHATRHFGPAYMKMKRYFRNVYSREEFLPDFKSGLAYLENSTPSNT